MKLLTHPRNKPNCLVYAAAMVFDVNPKDIFRLIGHDGQEVWWPDMVRTSRLRGIHIQEIILFGLRYGYSLTPIQVYPESAPYGYEDKAKGIYSSKVIARKIFDTYLNFFDAILITPTHAIAWNCAEKICYDPNGMILGINYYEVLEAWLVNQIKSTCKV